MIGEPGDDREYAYMYKNYQMTCIGEIADEVNLRIQVNCWSQLYIILRDLQVHFSQVRFLLPCFDLNNSNASSLMSQQTS